MGLFNDQKQHKSKLPLIVSAVAVVTIVFTLYAHYDVRILILGYVLLVIAALLNQNMRLVALNREVKAQADRLSDLNRTLEERVHHQVEEIERIARLKRFLSSEVADLITAEGKESLLDSHRRQIACLFCDLRNFHSLLRGPLSPRTSWTCCKRSTRPWAIWQPGMAAASATFPATD